MRFPEIDELTIPQYDLMMKALQLRQVDEEFKAHREAYLGVVAKATKRNGKPAYRNFKSFYDYEKALNKLTHQERPLDSLSKHLKEMRERR